MANQTIVVYRAFVKFGPRMEDIWHDRQAIGWTDDVTKIPQVIETYKANHPEWEDDTVDFHHLAEEPDWD